MRLNSLAFCTVLCSFLGWGCVDNQIGRPCNSLNRTPQNGVSFVNPAPDCPTRLCMVTPPPNSITPGAMGHPEALAMCTSTCDTNDDCATSSDFTSDASRCTKYVCAVPSVVPGQENFCCQKLCVCQDDLIAGFNKDDSRSPLKLPRDASGVAIPSTCTKANKCKL